MGSILKKTLVSILVHSYLTRTRLRLRGELSAPLRMKVKTAEMLLDIYRRRSLSVLAGFLVPAELFHLYGAAPMFSEYLAAILAGSKYGTAALESAETEGHSRDGCSFHRATLGAGLSGYLPRFKLIVATSHLCDGQNKALEELAQHQGVPYLLLDVPHENSPAALDYLTAQLAELDRRLAQLSGRRSEPSAWQRLFELSNQTRQLMLEVNCWRQHHPSPLYGQAAFTLAFQALLMMGTPFLRDCYLRLLEELRAACPGRVGLGERYRIIWLLAYPFFSGNFVPYLEDELGVHAVAEELGYVYWPPLDPSQPLRSLAQKMLANPNLGPVSRRVRVVQELVEHYRADGVLHFSHWGCRQGCGGVRPIADSLNRLGVPFLELDGDCVDRRNYSEGQSRTRLEGFVELMEKRKNKSLAIREKDGVYLGIDIGSLSAKAVVIDGAGRILFQKIIFTGASSHTAAARLKEMVFSGNGFAGKLRRCVATGYGRAAVDYADEQITEISCHARGVVHQITGVETIIDIGGQDTKAIWVDGSGAVRRFVMNDKCAAGTGRFLELMARTLELDLEELGPQALRARNSAAISSLCTVFAESEVVSLVATGTPVSEIARGVCDSIATRTVAMLGRLGRTKRIAMTGGVAKNVGVVKALERALGTRLKIPPEPQISGALGAALLASDRGG